MCDFVQNFKVYVANYQKKERKKRKRNLKKLKTFNLNFQIAINKRDDLDENEIMINFYVCKFFWQK